MGRGCTVVVGVGAPVRCADHAKYHSVKTKAWRLGAVAHVKRVRREAYELLKGAGLCPGCKGDPKPGRVYCETCAARCCMQTPEQKSTRAKKTRANRRAAGKCSNCPNPRDDMRKGKASTRCVQCRIANAEEARRRRPPKGIKPVHCQKCGEQGHMRQTCPQIWKRAERMPRIEELAGMRPGAE